MDRVRAEPQAVDDIIALLTSVGTHDAAEIQRAALKAARRLGNERGQAHAHRRLAYAYTQLGTMSRPSSDIDRDLASSWIECVGSRLAARTNPSTMGSSRSRAASTCGSCSD